jgi:phosphoribosylglycinamide formyltransferase-1
MIRVAVLVSGGGTNLQALLDAESRGELGAAKIALVVSSSPDAYALERAANHGVETAVVRRKDYSDAAAYDAGLEEAIVSRRIDLVVMAGFLSIVGPGIIGRFERRLINIHPSLLPSFGGKGRYGLKVHELALAAGVKVTGATVHFVGEVGDGGESLLQKAVDVQADDTPETLQRRVMEQAEWVILPKAVALLAERLEK